MLHTGNKIFKNKLKNQLWLGYIPKSCWYTVQLQHKYSNKYGYINAEDINLSDLPKELIVYNLLEFDKEYFTHINKKMGLISAHYNNKTILNKKIVGRTNYLYNKIYCPKSIIKNADIDAIISSKEMVNKYLKKIKYACLINNYSHIDNIIPGEDIANLYLEYHKFVRKVKWDGLFNFTSYAKNFHKNIRELKLLNKIPLVEEKFINFNKLFLKEIYYKLATKPYKILPYLPYLHYYNGVNRANHGTVNIIRQGLFTIKLLQIFKKRNNSLYKKVFKNSILVKLILIRSHFVSLLRVGEGIVGLTESKLLPINLELIKNLFPNLDNKYYEIFTSETKLMNNHMLYSCILFKAILTQYKNNIINDKLIDYLSSMMLNYIHIDEPGNNNYMNVSNFKFNSIGDLEQYNLLTILYWFGHYMDHCRGPWSNIMEESFNKLILNTIKATQKDREDLIEFVQKKIIQTQIKGRVIKGNIVLQVKVL